MTATLIVEQTPTPANDAQNILEDVFGYQSFRDGQQEVIDLGAGACALGIDTAVPTLLKFQGYDNADLYNRDGYLIDDIILDDSGSLACDVYIPFIRRE